MIWIYLDSMPWIHSRCATTIIILKRCVLPRLLELFIVELSLLLKLLLLLLYMLTLSLLSGFWLALILLRLVHLILLAVELLLMRLIRRRRSLIVDMISARCSLSSCRRGFVDLKSKWKDDVKKFDLKHAAVLNSLAGFPSAHRLC